MKSRMQIGGSRKLKEVSVKKINIDNGKGTHEFRN
jgi:hypothetical protein